MAESGPAFRAIFPGWITTQTLSAQELITARAVLSRPPRSAEHRRLVWYVWLQISCHSQNRHPPIHNVKTTNCHKTLPLATTRRPFVLGLSRPGMGCAHARRPKTV